MTTKREIDSADVEVVNFGTFYVPDSHPTPSVFPSVFGGFFLGPFLVGLFAFVGGAAPCCLHSMHNACVRSEGERRKTRLPP